MKRKLSIRTRLLAVAGMLVLIVFAVSVTAILAVNNVDRNADAINTKWLAGSRILGDLSGYVFQFRLAETERALAVDQAAGTALETAASSLRAKANDSISAYVERVGGDHPAANLSDFRDVWQDYLIVHDAWVRADAYRHSTGLARAKSSLDWRYKRVSKALDELKTVNYVAASAETLASRQFAVLAKVVVFVASIAALGLAIALAVNIETTVIRPLGSITAALTRLAGGGLGIPVPEIGRDDEIGEMAQAFEIFRANAAELEEAHAKTRVAQEQAHKLARHDPLTGLPNRRVFAIELDRALARASADFAYSSVMIVDLDRFKPVNDVQGHSAGDRVLCEIARRLDAIPHKRKIVARLGGDEFAVIAETEADIETVRQDASDFATQVLAAVREPIPIDDRLVEIGASIGIAICPADGGAADDILRAADLAMYNAKHDGRDRWRFFERSMDEDLREEAVLADNLRKAIAAGEIEPYYQPLIGLDDDCVHGFEVLARWNHAERGFIPPDRFIAMAERLGLMAELTASILRQACRDAQLWPRHIRLAVNVSPVQLTDRLFPLKVLAILSEERFEPSRLELEITESALVGDLETAKYILSELQAVGVRVSLDDFGTGYSSLFHLRNLKFDKLKIDRSFVQSMNADVESAKIVDAVLGLASSLGMPVVAEGIENHDALARLVEKGCAFGQGFLFSKAVPRDLAASYVTTYPVRKIA